ncbi:MAG: cache domain-containing protein [Alphaproteobacteria bacterium]|nr:cache domain-containing protein [Alphaproteobacteria bacterium]
MSVTFAVIAAISFGVAAIIAFRNLEENARQRLQIVLETTLQARATELRNYSQDVDNDLRIVGTTSSVQQAVKDFSRAFSALGADPAAEARRAYIAENPHEEGSRDSLVKADDGSEYSELHAFYHSWFRSLVDARDYYDLFLVDLDGNIVYTVFKEDDFGTSLKAGPLKDTTLAGIYRKAVAAAPGSVVGSDFARYAPSKDIPAAFEGTPIYHHGRIAGALIVQLRLDPFDRIMQSSHALGDSFESYLVNSDRLMLSQSRFVENSILEQKVETPSVTGALSGATGFGIVDDYRGTPVLSAYRPFKWTGGVWGIVAELDVEEVERLGISLRRTLLIAAGIVTVSAGFLGWLLAARE